jgi:hypothetical protein
MKRKFILAIAFLLIAAFVCEGQTTVSGTITDAGSVAWAGGVYNFQTVSGSAQNVSGTLNGSGAYSVSITSTPGTFWVAQFCPLATAACYATGQFTIQGATQTVAPTPPAISISLINPPSSVMRAYTDGEITSAVVGSLYYNIGAGIYHGCTAVTGQACTTWANVGAGGTSTWPTLTGGTNSSSAFVCGTGCSITPSGAGVITATNAGGISPPAGDIGGSTSVPTVVATHLAAALPIAQGGTGTATPSLVAGSNVTITGSWPNQTINSSGGGGGGVTSFSGDGALLTNSSSTGAVTATLGSALAHRWWGNPTGSTATAGFNLLTASDIPTLNQSTTGNAATATVAVNAANLTGCTPSTAGDLCYWTGSAWSRVAGNASGTQWLQETSAGLPSWTTPAGGGNTTSTSLTANVMPKANGTNSIINSSVTDNATSVTTTDTGGWVGPSFTGTGTTAGVVDLAQGPTNSGSAPCTTATSICLQAPVAVTSYTMTLPGVLGTAGQLFNLSTSTAGVEVVQTTDFPDIKIIPAANCVNAVAGAGWSLGASGVVTCRGGTNNLGGYVSISDSSGTFGTFQLPIPEDWDTGALPYMRFQIASTDATNGHTIIPSIQVACYKGDGSTTDDVAPNAVHSLSAITLNGNANRFWSTSNVQLNSTDMTGCVAGAIMQVTVGRATDTATNAEFYSATMTFPRLIVVQAN